MRPALLLALLLLACTDATAPDRPSLTTTSSGSTVVRDGWHVILRSGSHQVGECWLPAAPQIPTADSALATCYRRNLEVPPPPPPGI